MASRPLEQEKAMSLLDRIRQRQLEEQTSQPASFGQDQKKDWERQKKDDVFNDLKAKIHMKLADLKMMKLSEKDYSRINVNGSGISLGHPIACTGTRVLVTLLHEMKRRNSRYGLECICGGGGLGIAAIFERI